MAVPLLGLIILLLAGVSQTNLSRDYYFGLDYHHLFLLGGYYPNYLKPRIPKVISEFFPRYILADQRAAEMILTDNSMNIEKAWDILAPDYEQRFREANPKLKIFPSDINLLKDSYRKRIPKLLEKTG
jgi:hypothetical protein